MKRRVFAFFVCLGMVFTIAACGTVEDTPLDSPPQTSATAPAIESTPEPDQTMQSTQNPKATAPDTVTPTAIP